MKFPITPYSKVGPLTWDMDASNVEHFLGSPSRTSRNRAGNTVKLWSDLMITCIFEKDTGLMVEVGFSKNPDLVFYDGIDLLAVDAKEVVLGLSSRDEHRLEGYGSQIFLTLGISLTGFSPVEPDVKAVTAFAKGRWDGLIPSMTTFDPSDL